MKKRLAKVVLLLLSITPLSPYTARDNSPREYEECAESYPIIRKIFDIEFSIMNIVLESLDTDKLLDVIESFLKDKDILILLKHMNIWEFHPLNTIKQINRLIAFQKIIRNQEEMENFTFGIKHIELKKLDSISSQAFFLNGDMKKITPDQMDFIRTTIPSVEVLILSWGIVTPEYIIKVLQDAKNLRKLSLKYFRTEGLWEELLLMLPPSMECINIKGSNYQGQCIELFNRFQCLKILNLNDCNIGDNCSRLLESLSSSIQELYIGKKSYMWNTEFWVQNLEEFQRFHHLKCLDLSRCRIDNFPILLVTLPQSMEKLILNEANYQGQNVEEFKRFKNLQRLELEFCKLQEKWPILLCLLSDTIVNLNLFFTDYAGQNIEEFGRFHSLEELYLGDCDLRDVCSDLLKILPETIQDLDLYATGYQGENLAEFQRLVNLKYLGLGDCQLWDKWPALILSLPENVEHLKILDSDFPDTLAYRVNEERPGLELDY